MTPDLRHDPASPGGVADQLAAKDRRIAELEARIKAKDAMIAEWRSHRLELIVRAEKAETELAGAHHAWELRNQEWEYQHSRAEKAEAEVERLTNILRDILKHVGLCHDSSDSNLNSFYTWVDDTLGGGGRDSPSLPKEATPETAANLVAPQTPEEVDEAFERTLAQERRATAARKERDG